MGKAGGLDAQGSIPSRAEPVVYPTVITVTGESSSTAGREKQEVENYNALSPGSCIEPMYQGTYWMNS